MPATALAELAPVAARHSALAPGALDQIFREARTRNAWDPKPLPESLLRELYDLAKWGPTLANTTPARFVFVTSDEARKTLSDAAMAGNKAKILQAPVTVIIGQDLDFADTHPRLMPAMPDMLAGVKGTPVAEAIAAQSSSLQGAYLIIAARSLGLDAGPMAGFDKAAVDAAFFAGTNIKSNFIVSLGYGTDENLYPRNPRLTCEEAAKIV